jgi:arylsulfatase A-like enzyme
MNRPLAKPPNILWVITTQWRAGAFGFAGDRNARTPRLDALARESLNFTQAVTPHPFGPFARAALLTGKSSPENGVVDYYDPLPTSARTIAHTLNDRGYATAFFGKWHLAPRARGVPLVGEAHAKSIVPAESRGGFKFWEGFEGGFLLNDPWLHGTRLEKPIQVEGYQSDVLAERASEWITHAGRDGLSPWFCMVSLEAPHPPYSAAAAGIVPVDPATLALSPNVPLGGDVEKKARTELAGYYAHAEATDRAIGGLLDRLSRENTVVVFTSVHGDMHGAHGLFRKGWPHEESVRVPLLVRAPGTPPATSESALSLVDLAALTQSLAEGTPWPDPDFARISMPSVVALPHQCDRVWSGVRTNRRKLVLNADGSPWLFFDLENDPWELRNLVGDAGRREEMAKLVRMLA